LVRREVTSEEGHIQSIILKGVQAVGYQQLQVLLGDVPEVILLQDG
jgi:hypothetical protein